MSPRASVCVTEDGVFFRVAMRGCASRVPLKEVL
jgi:hypothetical protein